MNTVYLSALSSSVMLIIVFSKFPEYWKMFGYLLAATLTLAPGAWLLALVAIPLETLIFNVLRSVIYLLRGLAFTEETTNQMRMVHRLLFMPFMSGVFNFFATWLALTYAKVDINELETPDTCPDLVHNPYVLNFVVPIVVPLYKVIEYLWSRRPGR